MKKIIYLSQKDKLFFNYDNNEEQEIMNINHFDLEIQDDNVFF